MRRGASGRPDGPGGSGEGGRRGPRAAAGLAGPSGPGRPGRGAAPAGPATSRPRPATLRAAAGRGRLRPALAALGEMAAAPPALGTATAAVAAAPPPPPPSGRRGRGAAGRLQAPLFSRRSPPRRSAVAPGRPLLGPGRGAEAAPKRRRPQAAGAGEEDPGAAGTAPPAEQRRGPAPARGTWGAPPSPRLPAAGVSSSGHIGAGRAGRRRCPGGAAWGRRGGGGWCRCRPRQRGPSPGGRGEVGPRPPDRWQSGCGGRLAA